MQTKKNGRKITLKAGKGARHRHSLSKAREHPRLTESQDCARGNGVPPQVLKTQVEHFLLYRQNKKLNGKSCLASFF